MQTKFEVGQKVLHPDSGNGYTRADFYGEVVEIDEAAGRARVAWPYKEWVHATNHPYGKCSDKCGVVNRIRRTWIKTTRLRAA